MSTRIAIASEDGTRIAGHFGRTPYFAVVTVEDGAVVSQELRENTFTAHARGGHGPDHKPGYGMGHGPASHAGILEGLGDCQAVICRGMGFRLREDLNTAGIESYVTDCMTVQEAVNAYLNGTLVDTGRSCGGHGQFGG